MRISVPARTEYFQLLRLCTAGVAGDVFGVDEIDDLKIAIEELAAVLVAAPAAVDGDSAMHFEFDPSGDRLVVEGNRLVDTDSVPITNEFLTTILDAVVDHHAIAASGGELRVRFEKQVRGG